MLILILRLESKFEYDENNIHTINVQKLHKLAVQCLERVASSAAQEFRQLIQHVLPPNVVAEIQQAAKKGANTPAKPKQEKVKQEVKRPSQKLTFDFMKK
jgi:histone H3/H4